VLNAHILEETGRKQRPDRLRRLLVVHRLATRLDTLDPFDADVPDDERLHRGRRMRVSDRQQT